MPAFERPAAAPGIRIWSRYSAGVPAPVLLISPRFTNLLVENKIKGFRTEVAYLR